MLGGFWGPFRDNLAQVAGVAVADIINVLNDQLGAHFFPQQARSSVTATHSRRFCLWCELLVRPRPCMSSIHWLGKRCHDVAAGSHPEPTGRHIFTKLPVVGRL